MKCFDKLQKQTAPLCVALGSFDGLHIGHKIIISEMCNYAVGNNLVSSVFTFSNSPSAILREMPRRAIISQKDKKSILDKCGVQQCFSIDFTQIMNISAESFIKDILVETLNAEAVFCGFNYRFGKSAAGDVNMLKKECGRYGVKVFVTDSVCVGGEAVSSSRIRDLIERGDVALANRLLGHPFSVCLPIVEGKQNGRTVGVPTLNQTPPDEFVTPRFGVYASYTIIDNKKYESVTNVGVRPTVGGGAKNYETHILGEFSGELYGQTVRTQLLDFVREERKFNDLQELSEQIKRDIKYIYDKEIFK